MNDKYRGHFDAMLRDIADPANRVGDKKLTAFWPAKGARYAGDLLVIGRAVNGWPGGGWAARDAEDSNQRSKIIAKAKSADAERPMLWVSDHWQEPNETNYRVITSRFWRVIRLVTARLKIADPDNDQEWPGHLAWSNLYKVAPDEGGNPSGRLCDAQFGKAADLIEEEIKQWQPQRILVLAGVGWFDPFAKSMGIDMPRRTDFIEGVGLWGKVPLVVCKHPQAKPGTDIDLAEKICAAFPAS